MFIYKTGNMFNSDANYFVDPVNTVGTSGKGLALEVKKRYPKAERIYQAVCSSGEFTVGEILQVPTGDDKFILFFPTKKTLEDPSKYSYIESGLEALKYHCENMKNNSIVAIPKLGCGLGGLEWNKVLLLIHDYLGKIEHVKFYIYGPNAMEE